jgi:Tol biopolymer transport system component
MVSAGTMMSNLSADKQFIVFQSQDEDRGNLVRMKISDGEQKRIGPVGVWARFSPDGKWVVYTHYKSDVAIWKVSTDGGEPVQVTKLSGAAHCPVVSPDNTRIAFVWWENPKNNADPKIAIASFADGSLIKTLPAPVQKREKAGRVAKHNIEWTPDGKAIDFIQLRHGVSNIWRQPIDGSPPVQITFFETGRIANFAYSPDFKHVALSRGNFASDVFLIKNSK